MHQEPALDCKGTPGAGARSARGLARAWIVLLVALSVILPTVTSSAFTLTTIAIDGSFDDWIGVRADTDNVVRDSQIPDDPDWPGQPDRDIYLLGATYDTEYLYLSWRRTAGGTKAITYGAYLDYEGDGLLQDGDKVVLWTVSTGNPYASYAGGTAHILHYHQARNSDGTLVHPEGDPMRDTHRTGSPSGDGETPDGWAQWQDGEDIPAETMDGFLSPDGIECEARIAWSDLGVSAGHPFAIHFASGNGASWGFPYKPSTTYKDIGGGRYLEENRGQIEDNAEPILYLGHRGVLVSPDNSSGGAPSATITYTHTVSNIGNLDDTFDLTALSSKGWTVEITNAAGNPITEVAVAASGTATVLVKVTIPGTAATGTLDTTVLTATSQSDPNITESATDSTRVGLVTVTPDQSGSMAPGETIEYSYTVQNNGTSSAVFDLGTTSTLGFTNTIVDGAGNPISYVSLASGETTTVVVRVEVPPTATVGQQDVMRLTATQQGNPSVKGRASGTTLVAEGLDASPDNAGYGGSNTWVQYSHTVTNSWPTTRTVSLSALSNQGWTVKIFAQDGITEITEVEVGPNGAAEEIIVRVAVPAGTATGIQDVTMVTAWTGGYSDTVTDTTTVRALSVYADSGYVNESDEYELTDTVFARATGLSPGDGVYFVWKDANGAVVQTSSERTVDTQGMAFDEYATLATDPPGDWVVELYDDRDLLLERTPFKVKFKAEITALSATDAPGAGDDVAVTSTTENYIGADINDSTMTYVIWWDDNGNGSFDAGDIYIDDTGAPVTWDGTSAVTPTHVTSGIDVPGNSTWSETTPWTMNNSQFPNQGTYNVTATWTDSGGNVIDETTTQFYSIPTLGWPLFILALLAAATLMWRYRDRIGSAIAPAGGGAAQ